MHTLTCKNGTLVQFNSDASGDVTIRDGESRVYVTVPCEDVVEFVAELVRREQIGRIEKNPEQFANPDAAIEGLKRQSPREILGL